MKRTTTAIAVTGILAAPLILTACSDSTPTNDNGGNSTTSASNGRAGTVTPAETSSWRGNLVIGVGDQQANDKIHPPRRQPGPSTVHRRRRQPHRRHHRTQRLACSPHPRIPNRHHRKQSTELCRARIHHPAKLTRLRHRMEQQVRQQQAVSIGRDLGRPPNR